MRKKRSKIKPKVHSQVDKHNESLVEASVAETIVSLAKRSVSSFFRDKYGRSYARIEINDHMEVVNLEDKHFKHYLYRLYTKDSGGKVISQQSLNNAVEHLKASVSFEGEIRECYLRLAWGKYEEVIYYDMTDGKWRCFQITKNGWKIIARQHCVVFRRFNQLPQVEPDINYDKHVLDRFLDIHHIRDPDQRLIEKVWIIASFIPDIAHAMDVTVGPGGSSKTTYCRHRKRIIDPDAVELLSIPDRRDEFVRQLSHNFLIVYDNVRRIPQWFSDEVCKAITGIGLAKRKLYTDDEDFVYSYKRRIILNGINNVLFEPDALDRLILTPLDRIPKEKRKQEAQVDAEFDRLRPQLLGYILDILVQALSTKTLIQSELNRLPRMADFAVWGEVIARAMGYKKMEFLRCLEEKNRRTALDALESDPVSTCIMKLMRTLERQSENEWCGSPALLLKELTSIASDSVINTESFWPKAGNSLIRRINILKSSLLEGAGIRISISRDSRENVSIIRITKIAP